MFVVTPAHSPHHSLPQRIDFAPPIHHVLTSFRVWMCPYAGPLPSANVTAAAKAP